MDVASTYLLTKEGYWMCFYVWLVNMVRVPSSLLCFSMKMGNPSPFVGVTGKEPLHGTLRIQHLSSRDQPGDEERGEDRRWKRKRAREGEREKDGGGRELVCDWFVWIKPKLVIPFLNVLPHTIHRKRREALNETSFYRCYIINYILIQQLRKQFSFTHPPVPRLF